MNWKIRDIEYMITTDDDPDEIYGMGGQLLAPVLCFSYKDRIMKSTTVDGCKTMNELYESSAKIAQK